MPDEPKQQLSEEDRKRLVITEGVYDQALELEALDKRLGDLQEDILDINGQMMVLQARANKLMGQRDEIRATFWNNIRGDYRTWFREMREAGLTVTYKRTKDADTDADMIMLKAVNLQEEAIKHIFRNFDLGHNGRNE